MIFFPYKTQLLFEHKLALLVALLVFNSSVQSLGIKPGGPHPGGPALGKPRSCFNVNFNSHAHGSRSGTKVPLALFE